MQLTPKQFFRPDQSTACIQHQTGRSHSLKRNDISECKTQSSYPGDPFVSLISLALIDSLWGEWKMITVISSGLTSEHSVFYTSLKVNLEEEFYSGVQQETKKKKIHSILRKFLHQQGAADAIVHKGVAILGYLSLKCCIPWHLKPPHWKVSWRTIWSAFFIGWAYFNLKLIKKLTFHWDIPFFTKMYVI